MMANIGGNDVSDEEYRHNASRSRLKSSSGVQDVLLTNSLVFPAIIFSACALVSGNLWRKALRVSGSEIG